MKILIYRLSSIGDIVITSPIVRCIKKEYPNAELHYITRNKYIQTIENNPHIAKIWVVEKSPMEVINELKKENFDYIIDLHKNLRSIYLRLRLGKKSYSFYKLNLRKWLLTTFKVNFLPKIHIVDRYFKAINKLGVKNDFEGLDFFISDKSVSKISELPNNFISIALGGTFATKRYPTSLIIAFIDKLPLPIVLLGGKTELIDSEIIKDSNPEKVINLCDKLSIDDSAQVLVRSKIVITNDTGMMHIAAALRKPIISIWGNTVPDFGMYPYFPKQENKYSILIENNNLHCRPCSKLGYASCPKKHFKCMRDIEPKKILEAVNTLYDLKTQ